MLIERETHQIAFSLTLPSICNVGAPGLISRLGRFPGEGNGYPLQYSSLENSMDTEAWQAIVHGVARSQTRMRHFHFY